MRRRFLLTIFVAMLIAASAVSVVQHVFFGRERTRLIDEQVDIVVSSLLSMDLNEAELDEMGEVVAEALESDPHTILVTVYGPAGTIQYRNPNAVLIFGEDVVPSRAARGTVEKGQHAVRLVNLKMNPGPRTLQVGLLLDRGQIQWTSSNHFFVLYAVSIFAVVVILTFSLTYLLMRPMTTLASYLQSMGASLGAGAEPEALPASLTRALNRHKHKDEFARLVSASRELGQRLAGTFRLNRASASQMAHEFKTPLTILRNTLESIEMKINAGKADEVAPLLREASEELLHLDGVMTAFLEWSGAEHSLPDDVIHAVKLRSLLEKITARLEKVYGPRVHVGGDSEVTVFGRRDHVEQAISNLIDNALKYSPTGSAVDVTVKGGALEVSNVGTGLPASVVERLGMPFNLGPNAARRSTGLGLAWVVTIAKLYGWNFTQAHRGERTVVTLNFADSGPVPASS